MPNLSKIAPKYELSSSYPRPSRTSDQAYIPPASCRSHSPTLSSIKAKPYRFPNAGYMYGVQIMLTLGEQQMALYEHRQDQGCHISHSIISQNKLSRLPFGFPFHNSYSPYSSLSNSKIIFEYHPTLTSGSNHSTSTGI